MKKKDRIKLMGAVVTVTKVLRIDSFCLGPGWSGPFKTTWTAEPLMERRAGWVVGFTHRRNGTVLYRGEDGPTFHPSECVPCVLVKYWPTIEAIPVPLDGFIVGGTPDNRHQRWGPAAKLAAKEYSKSFPRKNGRFCKYVHTTPKLS